MIENITENLMKDVAKHQDIMFEQMLVNHGILTNADPKPMNIQLVKKRLEEQGFEMIHTQESIGGKTTITLKLVKVVEVRKIHVEFKIDGANFK